MIRKRPWGITIIAGLLTLAGGLASLVIFVELIAYAVLDGIQSILISNPLALVGFLLFGCMPVVFYFTGVGLFLSKAWARQLSLFAVPLFLFLFFLHQSYKAFLYQNSLSVERAPFFKVIVNEPQVTLHILPIYLFLVVPMVVYFSSSAIVHYFELAQTDQS